MKLALGGVLLMGALLGLALPRGGRLLEPAPVAAAAAAPVSLAEAKVPRTPVTPVRSGASWGGETRLRRAANGHFLTSATVNGQPVEMVVDTGASIVALSEADARRIGIAYNPSKFEVIGTGASGAVRGQEVTIGVLAVGGREVRSLRAAVVEGLDVSLLGQTYLSRIGGVSMSGDEMVLR